jgi:hypothetical protein
MSKSSVVENGGQPLESRCIKQLPFTSYFEFRFGGRHLESAVNYVIEVVMTRSAVVENVGV